MSRSAPDVRGRDPHLDFAQQIFIAMCPSEDQAANKRKAEAAVMAAKVFSEMYDSLKIPAMAAGGSDGALRR